MTSTAFLSDLKARGLINQVSAEDEFTRHLQSGSRTLYCGFDPTADSLHIGSLVPLLTLRRFQLAGHKPIALVGGATGLIGDPSFKAAERQLNTPDVVAGWVEKIRAQVSQFIDFDCGANSAIVANNLDWTQQLSVLDFLRDVGKHFSVNNMINKESVKQRLEREGSGISFTEFAYSLLQGMDFAELNRRNNCTIQLGGSDQWGNIVSGIDLSRRQNQSQVFGITVPLVTKADGTKFGKTETGTVWLDGARTSPYAFYQFWLNVADADVYKFLRYFTFLPVEQIAEWEGDKVRSQAALAEEVTRLVHGQAALEGARRITSALFAGAPTDVRLEQHDFEQLSLDGLPSATLTADDENKPLTSLLADCGLGQGKQIKDALSRSAVFINGQPIGLDDNMRGAELLAQENAAFGRYFLVQMGKKKHFLLQK